VVLKYWQYIISFVTKHACDRRIDGQTDRRTDEHNYDPQDRVSIAAFAVKKCILHVAFVVWQAVRQLPYLDGRTNTTAALNLLRRTAFHTSAGDRPSAPNVAVLVANGESTIDKDRVSTEAAACRDAGITMVVVAADRTMVDSVELRSIVSLPTQRNYFTTPSLSALPNITQSIIYPVLLCPGFEFFSTNFLSLWFHPIFSRNGCINICYNEYFCLVDCSVCALRVAFKLQKETTVYVFFSFCYLSSGAVP